MISISVVFWMYVILFAIIGGMRGWAKELLVTFSVILALTLTTLLQSYVPFIRDVVAKQGPTYFWLRTIILLVLVFFGYQTPNIARFAPKMTREKFQDTLLGVILGALNGFLIIGSVWHYMDFAQYPFAIITKPASDLLILKYLAPRILGVPAIYFAVVIAFIFVIVVFI
jgi:uncharacterized membrane protein required for colicin V production